MNRFGIKEIDGREKFWSRYHGLVFPSVCRSPQYFLAQPSFAILAEVRDPKQAIPARITTHRLPPRILFPMEAAKAELEKAGLIALARDIDI